MPRKPDTPCAGGCGKLLWGGSSSKPAGERMCRQCRTSGPVRPVSHPVPAGSAEVEGRSAQLEAIRRHLFAELVTSQGKDSAPIARALLEVMREINGGKPAVEQPERVSGVISLAAEVAKRRQAAG